MITDLISYATMMVIDHAWARLIVVLVFAGLIALFIQVLLAILESS